MQLSVPFWHQQLPSCFRQGSNRSCSKLDRSHTDIPMQEAYNRFYAAERSYRYRYLPLQLLAEFCCSCNNQGFRNRFSVQTLKLYATFLWLYDSNLQCIFHQQLSISWLYMSTSDIKNLKKIYIFCVELFGIIIGLFGINVMKKHCDVYVYEMTVPGYISFLITVFWFLLSNTSKIWRRHFNLELWLRQCHILQWNMYASSRRQCRLTEFFVQKFQVFVQKFYFLRFGF